MGQMTASIYILWKQNAAKWEFSVQISVNFCMLEFWFSDSKSVSPYKRLQSPVHFPRFHSENKSSSGDEISELDVTYLLSVYLITTKLRPICTSGIFSE